MKDGIHNAVIESISLDDADRGFLTGWVTLNYGSSGQGFGGHVLYLPKLFRHHGGPNVAGHFIWRVMEITGVSKWVDVKGKTVRVRVENGFALAIGHIIKDDWFCPDTDFAMMNKEHVDMSKPISDAVSDVLAECKRQTEVEGFTAEHDAEHRNQELAYAAACYAGPVFENESHRASGRPPTGWPWSADWWKPTDHRRNLVKAGALILKEIERIDAAAHRTEI